MTIAYELGNALYLNITNKCPCDCVFCIRNTGEGVNYGESLWLKHEPAIDEIMKILSETDYSQYREVVFCGYGEPTERLEVLLECAKFLKQHLYVRLNTNGLSDLINGKKTAPLLANYIDCVSISLNAPDADIYNRLCSPIFGDGSFEAMIQFTKDCKECITQVMMSVMGSALNKEELERCRALCDLLDVPLRVR